MTQNALWAVSPIDGRYSQQTSELSPYFSEAALIRYRLRVETEYLIALCNLPLPQLKSVMPTFFQKHRVLLYTLSFLAALSLGLLNLQLGIHQIGLNPKTILPWPLNALTAFAINQGMMICFSFFLFWDTKASNAFCIANAADSRVLPSRRAVMACLGTLFALNTINGSAR